MKTFWQWHWLLWGALLKTVNQKQPKLLPTVSDDGAQNHYHVAGLAESSTNHLRLVFRVSILKTLLKESSSRNLKHFHNSKLWKSVYVHIPAQQAFHRGEPHTTTSLLLYRMADMLQSVKLTDKLIIKQCIKCRIVSCNLKDKSTLRNIKFICIKEHIMSLAILLVICWLMVYFIYNPNPKKLGHCIKCR